jgi:thiamine kinase-like enzyme
MARELAIYREVLQPLQVTCPELHSFWQTSSEQFFLLEDVGLTTLEKQPQLERFQESARVLARLRCNACVQLQTITVPEHFRVTPDFYLQALDYLLQHDALDDARKAVLASVMRWLPERLEHLYEHVPATLCHNDYHVKNLVLRDQTVVPIDWAMSYVSPYLGDMYSLLHGAAFRKIGTDRLIEAYTDEMQIGAARHECVRALMSLPLEEQIALGAVCILITSIRWTLLEAMYELPESKKWIPAMIRNIEYYARQLQ